jgi:hypothetical protein
LSVIDERVRVHEAGHAVAYWHHGVGLEYVTTRPPASGHRGATRKVDSADPTTATDLENEMICTAAGEIAEKRLPTGPRPPNEYELCRRFQTYPARVLKEPNLAAEDEGIFVVLGQARDDEIRNTGADAPTGPSAWLQIWQQAEQLIEKLWPAVTAISRALEDQHTLSGAQVSEIAEAAMKRQP